MNPSAQLTLSPLGRTRAVPAGTPLLDLLAPEGVEFPCGGRGRCKGCKVRVLDGSLPCGDDDAACFTAEELSLGWRLACGAHIHGDLKLEVAQWECSILGDNTHFEFTPRPGFGVAVDLGTTTLVVQVLDLKTGRVLAVGSELNAQARQGADIMSRIEFALDPGGCRLLQETIRVQLGRMIQELVQSTPAAFNGLNSVVLVGNSAMYALFCGVEIGPLAVHPFELEGSGLREFESTELEWSLPGNPVVRFLPCLGSFVGSDILSGMLAIRIQERTRPVALVDLGTNGEMVVGNGERVLCASTAAGPAFEGARISIGMRAATGAITGVRLAEGRMCFQILGDSTARGICGSGLVDAVSCGLDLGLVQASGRLAGSPSLPLVAGLSLTQADIRELQLAKGAISAGLRVLIRQWGCRPEDLEAVYLAGAFGNYINRSSARRIGLLSFPDEKVVPSGNSALLGAKLALFQDWDTGDGFSGLIARTRHVALNEDPEFQEIFVEEMTFPQGPPRVPDQV